MTFEFVPLTASHWQAVWQIENSAHLTPWAESLIKQTPAKHSCNRVLLVDGKLVGFFYSQCVAGEASLLNIAVAPSAQGKGYGRALMQEFLEQSERLNAEEAWLEVRASNTAAISLYESLGFNEIDRRRGYYPTRDGGTEDAIVMSCWLQGDFIR